MITSTEALTCSELMPLHYMLERKEFYGKSKTQHYVPRMYLKRFGYGNIGDEYISVLKLDNGTVLDNRKVENLRWQIISMMQIKNRLQKY